MDEVLASWRMAISDAGITDTPPVMAMPVIASNALRYAVPGKTELATWWSRRLACDRIESGRMVRWTDERAMTGAEHPPRLRASPPVGYVPSHSRQVARAMADAATQEDLDAIMIHIGCVMLQHLPQTFDLRAWAQSRCERIGARIPDFPGINKCTPELEAWGAHEQREMAGIEAIADGWRRTLTRLTVVVYVPHISSPDGPRPVTPSEISGAWADKRHKEMRARELAHARRI